MLSPEFNFLLGMYDMNVGTCESSSFIMGAN
jgi:hypothetical protein